MNLVNLQILYNNNTKSQFKAGWGFSCLIRSNKNNILFDTGWNGNILLYNMKLTGFNPDNIDKVVISHTHWAHIGGLSYLLNLNKNLEVYLPKSTSINFKNEIRKYANLVEVSKPVSIYDNIWTTGELNGKVKEQSLILNTKKGNVILTGCAHPGVPNIINKLKEFGDLYALIGGFHDSKIHTLKNIPCIIPCHCTKKLETIKKEMQEFYKDCYVGSSFKF